MGDLRQAVERELRRLAAKHRSGDLGGRFWKHVGRPDEHEGPHVIHRPAHEQPQVAPIVDEGAHETDGLRRVVGGERIEQRARLLPVGRAEELVDILDPDLALGEGGDLIEDALRVAEGALRVTRDRLQRGRLDLHLLGLRDRGELLDHHLVRDPAEIEALGPGHDGGRDLL